MKQSIFMVLAKARSWLYTSRNSSCQKCSCTHHEYIIAAAASAMHLAQTAADFPQTAANGRYMLLLDTRSEIPHAFLWKCGPQISVYCNKHTHKKTTSTIATVSIFYKHKMNFNNFMNLPFTENLYICNSVRKCYYPILTMTSKYRF